MESNATATIGGSFRDPAGFMYVRDGILYRQINSEGETDYRALVDSGLYDELRSANLIVGHEEVPLELAATADAVRVIRPEPLPFVSYPYEWCYSALRDAALLTLDIQKRALKRGVTLKDATSFNVQFRGRNAIFIDTLSFETYSRGPWNAYQQFCQHFLAPLALRQLVHPSLAGLTRTHMHGVPLDLASALLPASSWIKPSLLLHIHLHARAQRRYRDSTSETAQQELSKARTMNKAQLERLVQHLELAVQARRPAEQKTVWTDYYDETNYSEAGMSEKVRLVGEALRSLSPEPRRIFDFGANTGRFSREAAAIAEHVVAFDFDETVIEQAYQGAHQINDKRSILPLVMDLENPSPRLGWAHQERDSLMDRGDADAGLALALIHHLAIGNNVPLVNTAAFFANMCRHLVIEFVPKEDSQVKRLLANREDFFHDYHPEGFEAAYSRHFNIVEKWAVGDTVRTLYLMERKD